MDLIRTKNSRYGARHKAGDRFKATANQAKVLVALGEATYAPPKVKVAPKIEGKRSTYQRRDMVAAEHSPAWAPVDPVWKDEQN